MGGSDGRGRGPRRCVPGRHGAARHRPQGQPIGDGRLHRFDVEGDRKGSRNGYYTLHLDGRPAGAFGCWKRGIKETWKANGAPLSDFDLAKLMREIEAERKRREQKQAKRQKEAAEDAAELWGGYEPAPADHPYLVRKQIQPHGARIDGQGRLVLAVADADGKIWSLQTIDADGGKLFMPGGRKRGCMFLIGEPGDRIVIAEGFATGASIHEATGLLRGRRVRCRQPRAGGQAIRGEVADGADRHRRGRRLRDATATPACTIARKAAEAVGADTSPCRRSPDSRTARSSTSTTSRSPRAPRPSPRSSCAAFPEPSRSRSPTSARRNRSREPSPRTTGRSGLPRPVAELNETLLRRRHGRQRPRRQHGPRRRLSDRERLVFSREADIRLLLRAPALQVGVSPARATKSGRASARHGSSTADAAPIDRIALIPDGPCPPDVYNLWRGFGVEPKAGAWARSRRTSGRSSARATRSTIDWLVGWLAYCVQHPGKQAEVAVVLRGLKGTGKGMVGQMLMRIFRNHSLHITHSKHLVGNFNAHLVDALFLFLDEAFWAGDKQGEGTLKALITERTIMIEPKGVDAFQMPNRLKILMASQQRLGGAGLGRRAALLRARRVRHAEGRQGLLHAGSRPQSRATSWRRSSTTCSSWTCRTSTTATRRIPMG